MRRSNGTGGQTSQEQTTALNTLQTDYAPYSIYFSLLGLDFIDNDTYYDKQDFSLIDTNNDGKFDNFSPNSHCNAIDIYLFADDKLNFGLAANIPGTALVIGGNADGINLPSSHTLSHEVGHCLGLFHTFHGGVVEPIGGCPELVNGSNCTTCGDFVCDTPADPAKIFWCINQATCAWTGYQNSSCCGGSAVDANGNYYNPNPHLIMAYTTPNCMTIHTSGQVTRMFSIISNSSLLQNTLYMRLIGPSPLCNSGDYSVSNLPSGATIVWSSSSNISKVSQGNPSPCTFQKYSNGNGSINAAVTTTCGTTNLSLPVHTGPYSSSDYPISGPSSAACNSYVYYSIPSLSGVTSINWTWPSGWTYSSGQNSANLAMRTNTSGGAVMVGVNNTCGQSGSYAYKYTMVNCGYSLIVTPNPASNNVIVTIPEVQTNSNDTTSSLNSYSSINAIETDKVIFYKVSIIDKLGIIYYSVNKFDKSFTISVSDLKNGNYIIIVDDGVKRYTSPLLVVH
jgi:PKD-like domain/Pregnancy-associated plasma protein-A